MIFFAIGYGIFYLGECKQQEKIQTQAVNGKNLALMWLVTVIMFALSNISYTQIRSPFSGSGASGIFNTRTLVDLAGFFMLELFYMQKADWDQMEEMAAIQNILQTQYMQYRKSQENIDLLNRKYHDLKHQIQIVRNESCEEKRNEYLEEIESGLSQYEAEIKTGNSVLDTILTSKSDICLKHGITFTVVADGKLLSYLHVMDLCTIFGNALDNAIEYELQLENPETRMIHVKISRKKKFICILVENYYEGSWNGKGDLPETTKKNRNYHGYGLKSMQYSVKKYGGYLNTNVADNWFRVEMLLPGAEA